MKVAEPEPGRIPHRVRHRLQPGHEVYTVAPEGSKSLVRISTTWEGAGGVGGFFERLFAPAGNARHLCGRAGAARRLRSCAPRYLNPQSSNA